MKIQQIEVIKNILDSEQITISKLAKNTNVDRSTLSKLINHNVQLSDKNWEKINNFYPEHSKEFKKLIEEKSKIKVVIEKPSEEDKKNRVAKGSISIYCNVENIESKKETKTKEENRHRNLNCPDSNYHMKVPYKDLLRARPLCPLTQLPMMLKEEVKKYKTLDENEKKIYIESLNPNINLFNI